MQKYINNVQDQFGNALDGVTVTINESPGGGLAAIFSDNGVTPKANPFTNDSDGEFNFYAANARYDIELTGPLTESITDIRLLDIAAIVGSLSINTDIATATPPTTEAVTGNFEIYDLDDDDLLAQFGFVGNNTLGVRNRMHGGQVILSGENAAGTFATLFAGDPDGAASLTWAGVVRLATTATSLALRSQTSTDAENRLLVLQHQDGVQRAVVGHAGDDVLLLRNQIHGGNVTLDAEDAGGNVRQILTGDPDGTTVLNADTDLILQRNVGENFITAVAGGNTTIFATLNEPGIVIIPNSETQLFFNDVKTFITSGAGTVGVVGDTNTDVDNRWIGFYQLGGTLRARIGHFVGSDFHFRNEIHGGITQIDGEDTGGVARTMVQCDPDGVTEILAVTNGRIAVNFTETAILCVANGSVELYENAIIQFQTRDSSAASALTGAQVKHHDGNFYDVGLAKLPLNTISAAEDIDENNQQFYTRKNAGGAVTLELQSDSNIQTGTAWQISNVDTEALTIDATTNSCTLNFLNGGGAAPPTGNRTLAQSGVCSIIKIGVSEYDIFGNAGLS